MSCVEIAFPATPVDLAEVFGRRDVAMWHAGLRQIAGGPSWAARVDGAAIAIGGYCRDAQCWEGWFWTSPAAASHLSTIIRTARLTLRSLGDDPVYVVARSRAGRRIARLVGFEAYDTLNGREVWISWKR